MNWNITGRWVVLFFFAFLFLSCKEEFPSSPHGVEKIFIKKYGEIFNIHPKHVPVVYSSDWNHWTSAIYYQDKCYRIYLNSNFGSSFNVISPLLPKGEIKVLCIIIDYPVLQLDTNIKLWENAQNLINDEHLMLSEYPGTEPIVQFSNTNLLVPAADLPVKDFDSILTYLDQNLINRNRFDVLALVDLDVQNPSGGFAVVKKPYVKIGWFYDMCEDCPLDQKTFKGIANAVYHHEIGHLWGWEHGWSDADTLNHFITEPALFGWTDSDFDGIPEILDSSPYGIDND